MLPDVRLVLPLVQGLSFEAMRRKLRLDGTAGASAEARRQATQAKRDLYARIQHGGQKMPPREHLQEYDLDMLDAGSPNSPERPTRGRWRRRP